MTDQQDEMVKAIVERNRKDAKQAQEKAAMIGAAIAFGAFQIVVGLGIVHLPPTNGFNIYRLAGAALCGGIGGAIGKWLGAPKTRR